MIALSHNRRAPLDDHAGCQVTCLHKGWPVATGDHHRIQVKALHPLSGTKFIGGRLPPPVTQAEVTRYLNSDVYAAAHPELEASVMRYLEKRELRQGRN